MGPAIKVTSALLGTVLLTACASAVPPTRIGDYVSAERRAGDEAFAKIEQRPLQAGLVVVSDTAEPGAAPNLPEEAMLRLAETLQQDIGRAIPVTITEVLSADHIGRSRMGIGLSLLNWGGNAGSTIWLVVVLSSTEQEYPVTLFLGWTTHAQPGFRRDNWSLLEFALLDLKQQQLLMQAEGRGWATLDRPSAPGINQWYPASICARRIERRIWPPTYEGAPNTLRVVSFEQAAKRLVLKLQNSWLGSDGGRCQCRDETASEN